MFYIYSWVAGSVGGAFDDDDHGGIDGFHVFVDGGFVLAGVGGSLWVGVGVINK